MNTLKYLKLLVEDKERILKAAKNPQLCSKLEQAPVSLITRNSKGEKDKFQTEANIDKYMGALIDGVRSGDFHKIKNVSNAEVGVGFSNKQ